MRKTPTVVWPLSARGLAAAFVLAIAAAGAPAAEADRAPFVEVQAEGKIEVAPDLALIDFGVITEAPTAAEAARQNAQLMSQIVAAVKKSIGTDGSVSTGGYNVHPVHSAPGDGSPPRITGYAARNVVQARTRALPRVGELIDLAVKSGANQVQRIAFSVEDTALPQREALTMAVAQARAKAAAIAQALGGNARDVISVVEQDTGGVRPLMRDVMIARAEVSTPIEPGLIEIRARVTLKVMLAR